MITCAKCHKFVKDPYLKIGNWTDEIKEAKGTCKTHGLTDIDYDDFEEFEDTQPPPHTHQFK